MRHVAAIVPLQYTPPILFQIFNLFQMSENSFIWKASKVPFPLQNHDKLHYMLHEFISFTFVDLEFQTSLYSGPSPVVSKIFTFLKKKHIFFMLTNYIPINMDLRHVRLCSCVRALPPVQEVMSLNPGRDTCLVWNSGKFCTPSFLGG